MKSDKFVPTFSRATVSRYVVPFLTLLNLGITITLAATLNLWLDEAYSLQTTGKDLSYVIKQAFYAEVRPPLYFVLLYVWRSLNHSPFFARLFSIFCTSLTIYVIAKASKRFLPQIHPGWISAAIALNPLTIYVAVEIRLYAFTMLLSSLLLLFFYDGYLSDSPKIQARYAYIFFALVGLYTEYFLGFLLVANASTLFILRRWQALRSYLLGMVVTAIFFVPMLFVLSTQMTIFGNTASLSGDSSALPALLKVCARIGKFVLPVHWDANLLEWLRILIFGLGIVFTVFIILKRRSRFNTSNNLALVAIVATISIFFFATVMWVFHHSYLTDYHAIVLFLPSMFLAFSIMASAVSRKPLIIGTIIIVFFCVTSLFFTYAPMAKFGDWARVAAYIMKLEKPGEPIVFFRHDGLLVFRIYYKGGNPLVPLPLDLNWERFDVHREVLRDESQIFKALASVPIDFQRFWLVTWSPTPFLGVDFHYEILQNFMRKYGVVLSEKVFYDSRVQLVDFRNESLENDWRQRMPDNN